MTFLSTRKAAELIGISIYRFKKAIDQHPITNHGTEEMPQWGLGEIKKLGTQLKREAAEAAREGKKTRGRPLSKPLSKKERAHLRETVDHPGVTAASTLSDFCSEDCY